MPQRNTPLRLSHITADTGRLSRPYGLAMTNYFLSALQNQANEPGCPLYGFTPLDTPVIESSDVLLAKGGGETEKQIYRFMKGDTDLSLRFDLTVPLAKYVAQNYGHLAYSSKKHGVLDDTCMHSLITMLWR